MQIVFDHTGFRPAAPKKLLAEAPEGTIWTSLTVIRTHDGLTVLEPTPALIGSVEGWSNGPWWSIDVSPLTQPGRYALRWATTDGQHGQSEGFAVSDEVHGEQLVSDIVHYFKGQRCSGIWDTADRSAPRVGDGRQRDVHGGWYDASGDYSKYLSHLSYANFLNPQQTPLVVWTLARAWHMYRDRGASSLLTERIRDEALHGADFLVRMQDPTGFWYMTVFDKWSKVPSQRELASYRTQLGQKGDDYQAGWRQGGGMAVAALALASALGDGPDHQSHEYLECALRGFEHLCEHGLEYLDDGRENVIDDTCALLAAVELCDALGDGVPSVVAIACEHRASSLIGRRRQASDHVWLSADGGERSWFHASDAGLPTLALLRYTESTDAGEAVEAGRSLARELIASQIALGRSVTNPFGYPPHWVQRLGEPGHLQWFFPHDNESGYWWQGENARLASLAVAALAVDQVEGARDAAAEWLGWILGANPFDVCMLQGHGRNNPPYEPGYYNAPGGVCNGITSAVDDERNISFRPMPSAADMLHSWRWGEQWLPHAAWLLLALVMLDDLST